jgi:outer membrane lipoprotein-sorting protein
MRSIRLAITAVLLLLTAVAAEAGTPAPVNIGIQDVIDTVEKSYRALSDVTADFFQRSTLAEKKREMRADGQMSLKMASGSDPLKFRFDYFRPTTQEIVSNGKTMWMYLPQNNQVIISDVSFVFNPAQFDPDRDRASNFLQGLGRISKDFFINFSPQRQDMEGNYILELTPRRATATIEKLFIVVRRDAVMGYVQNNRDITKVVNNQLRQELAFPVLSTTVIDHQQNSTIMEFSNVRTNTRLSDALFDFILPGNVQIVKPPRQQ